MRAACIIPTKDRAAMLARALDSVFCQTIPVDEIIVVDDGSLDDTAGLVANQYPAARLLRLAGLGPGPARNAGAAMATAEIFFFLDSDDCWQPTHVERLLTLFTASQAMVAYAPVVTLDEINGGEFLVPEPGMELLGDCFADLLAWCSVLVSGFAVRATAFQAAGGFGGHGFEDWSLFLRLADRHPFAWSGPVSTVTRTLHRNSICARVNRRVICLALDELKKESAGFTRDNRRQARRRFEELAAWTENQPDEWESIQQWYQGLRRARLVRS